MRFKYIELLILHFFIVKISLLHIFDGLLITY